MNVLNKIQNIEAEQKLLSCFFMDSELRTRFIELKREYFTTELHVKIFDVIEKNIAENKPIDVISFDGVFSSNEQDEFVNLLNSITTTANFNYYLEVANDYYNRRKILAISNNMRALVHDTDSEVDDILLNSETQLVDIKNSDITDSVNPINSSYISNWYSKLVNRSKNELPGISTGFDIFDKATGGLIGGNLYVVAARPAMGKSAFALNIASYIAQNGKAVVIFSLEMSKDLIIQRLLAAHCSVSNTKLKRGSLESEEYSRVCCGFKTLFKDNLFYVDDTGAVDYKYITLRSQKLKNKLKKQGIEIGCIVVDYLQIMGSDIRDPQQAVSQNSQKMKTLAKNLDVPVILLSQLSRAVETRADKRPTLSDLRESGAIEQDADLVAMLYRDDYYNRNSTAPGVAEVIIPKQRDGRTGVVKLYWDGETTKFYNKRKPKEKQEEK